MFLDIQLLPTAVERSPPQLLAALCLARTEYPNHYYAVVPIGSDKLVALATNSAALAAETIQAALATKVVDVEVEDAAIEMEAGSPGSANVDAVATNSGASRAAATTAPTVFHLMYFHLRYSMLTLLRYALLEQPMLM